MLQIKTLEPIDLLKIGSSSVRLFFDQPDEALAFRGGQKTRKTEGLAKVSVATLVDHMQGNWRLNEMTRVCCKTDVVRTKDTGGEPTQAVISG